MRPAVAMEKDRVPGKKSYRGFFSMGSMLAEIPSQMIGTRLAFILWGSLTLYIKKTLFFAKIPINNKNYTKI